MKSSQSGAYTRAAVAVMGVVNEEGTNVSKSTC